MRYINANELIKDDKILGELFNNRYVNIVKKASGLSPNCIGNSENPNLDISAGLDVINEYKDHPNRVRILK